jgi:ligand-binding SRPBCC domain-containing protein
MKPDELQKLTRMFALVVEHLAQIQARSEIALKAQSLFLGKVSGQPWQPIFEDLQRQCLEAAVPLRQKILAEFDALSAPPTNPPHPE